MEAWWWCVWCSSLKVACTDCTVLLFCNARTMSFESILVLATKEQPNLLATVHGRSALQYRYCAAAPCQMEEGCPPLAKFAASTGIDVHGNLEVRSLVALHLL